MDRRLFLSFIVPVIAAALVSAQAQFSDAVRAYIKVDAPVVALTNVRVIDGTGAPARPNQTIIISNGTIDRIGDSASVAPPAGATTLDLSGRSVIPGLVMVHEHLYYPTGPGVYGQLGESFSRLYLAGGVTTMRTGGNVNGFMDLKLKRLIDSGQKAGPAIDATAPYLNGVNTFSQMRDLKGPEDVRRQVAYWADEGATSFKAYMQISREELRAAIEEAHKRGLKITGHLCSVTYAEAADLGIDNLEHGFLAATDFVTDKQPDVCPGQGRGQQTVAALDENGEPFKALVRKLIDRRVALTSTLTVFETYTPGRPVPPGVDVLLPQLKEQFLQNHARTAATSNRSTSSSFPRRSRSSARLPRREGCSLPEPTQRAAAGSSLATRISVSSSCSSRRVSTRSKRLASARRTERSTLGAMLASARSRLANRRIWSSSVAILQRRLPTCGTSRSCSSRGLGSIP